MTLAGLGPVLLSVPVFRGGSSVATLRESRRWLRADGALIVFPSGIVSRLGAQGLRDAAWSSGFAWLAAYAQAPLLPVHIAARNSAVFYGVSMLAPPSSTLLLPREMFAATQTRISFTIGSAPMDASNQLRRSLWRRMCAGRDIACPDGGWVGLQQRLAGLGASLPVLFRQYVDIADPECVAFFDLGVDPAFGNCVDGLIRLDLTRLKAQKRARYLNPHAATKRVGDGRNLLVTIGG